MTRSVNAGTRRSSTRTREPVPIHPSSTAVEDALRTLQGACVCGNLRMAARLVTAYYDSALRPCGIEANQMMMLWVAHADRARPASQLAHAAGMDQSTASRNLAVLEARGLVATVPSPADRRLRLVRLTRRGKSTLVRAFPRWQQAQADLAALTSDIGDVVRVGRLLRKVSRRLQEA
jgi:DNA-binding MarR family transcriptional regulator